MAGKVRAEARAKGGFELDGEQIEILQIAVDYPIGPKGTWPRLFIKQSDTSGCAVLNRTRFCASEIGL